MRALVYLSNILQSERWEIAFPKIQNKLSIHVLTLHSLADVTSGLARVNFSFPQFFVNFPVKSYSAFQDGKKYNTSKTMKINSLTVLRSSLKKINNLRLICSVVYTFYCTYNNIIVYLGIFSQWPFREYIFLPNDWYRCVFVIL